MTPAVRIRRANQAPPQKGGLYVLYWMTAARRRAYNFGLQRAVELASEMGVGLLVFEPLRVGYRWASDRIHTFVLEGMVDNGRAFADSAAAYYPYVEPAPGAGKGLLAALAESATVVVTDDYPCFFLPRMLTSAADSLPVRVEAVDSNGLYPMRATERVFTTAASFRRHLQKELPAHLGAMPERDPLARGTVRSLVVPREVTRQWPPYEGDLDVGDLPIDHSVKPGAQTGGAEVAGRTLLQFLDESLPRYGDERNQPEADVQSHLSPYLHFGHLSAHQVFLDLMEREEWSPERLAPKPNGSRHGWWGTSAPAESFLDEFVTWREIGLNMCVNHSDYAGYESLPEWARTTMAKHESDPREYLYTLEEFEAADTHDALWNAAQNQLVREGIIHNYLRMLWGKKIYEWSKTPKQALEVMVELNNKYALDGRDPNSYSGIFWVLGRYDRAWGPERPIFGKIRYMSSDNTARKVRVKSYIERYDGARHAQQQSLFSG